MADAFTEANKLRTAVAGIDRARAIITTRQQAEQEIIERERRAETEAQQFEIRASQEERSQSQFELNQQVLAQEIRVTQHDLDRKDSFSAFDRYLSDGNPRHLNNLFRNPRIRAAEAAGGPEIVSFDKIDVANDQVLIQQSNLDPNIFAEEEAIKQFIKITNSDGTKEIIDLQPIFASTGYLEQLEDKQLSKLERKVRIGKAEAEIAKILKGISAGKQLNLTQQANVARFISQLSDEELEKFKRGAETAEEIFPAKKPKETAAEFKAGQRKSAREKLDELDPSDPEQFLEGSEILTDLQIASPRVARLKFTAKEANELAEISQLIELGELAGQELKDKSTGIIDNFFIKIRDKIFSVVRDDTEARAAYAAYRNVIRHILFGSALTQTEIKSFTEAYGDITDQLAPLLQKFKTNLRSLRAKTRGILSQKDPDLVKFGTNVSIQKVEDVIRGVDRRLLQIEGYLLTADESELPSGIEKMTGQIELAPREVTPASERIFVIEE